MDNMDKNKWISREMLMKMFDHFPEAVVLIDKDKKIVFNNATFNEINSIQETSGKVFGVSISCLEGTSCNLTGKKPGYCINCKFDRDIQATLTSKSNISIKLSKQSGNKMKQPSS